MHMTNQIKNTIEPLILKDRSTKFFEAVEHLRCDFSEIGQNWNNRLVLESTPLWEGYLNGRFDLVWYIEINSGADKIYLACSISANIKSFKGVCSDGEVKSADFNHVDGRQDKIMFVDVVQMGNEIKVRIPVSVRFYCVPDEFCRLGTGSLYRLITFGGFCILALAPKWEVNPSVFDISRHITNKSSGPMVKRGTKIVNCVTYDEREKLCDWFFRFIDQLEIIRLSKDCYRPGLNESDIIEVVGQRGGQTDKVLNMALGPLDL